MAGAARAAQAPAQVPRRLVPPQDNVHMTSDAI